MSMMKRMTDKFSHLGLKDSSRSKPSSPAPQPAAQLPPVHHQSTPQQPSQQPETIYAAYPRGSLSTQRTSGSGAPGGGPLDAAADGRYAEIARINLSFAATPRPKGTYRLRDFDILRTLGMGSFGRVHLCASRPSHRRK
jgi:protein kinase A